VSANILYIISASNCGIGSSYDIPTPYIPVR